MKVASIRYERLVNRGNYENEKFCVEVTVEDGENPHEAFKEAKRLVHEQLFDPALLAAQATPEPPF